MVDKIARFDDFWATYVNGYILLWNADDFSRLTQNAKALYSEEDWTMFKLSLATFSRLSDPVKHRRMDHEARAAIHRCLQTKPELPIYTFEGTEAQRVAKTYIEACTMSPASKGLFYMEEIEIEGNEHWLCREYYLPSLMERVSRKRREAKQFVIDPRKIRALKGESTNFVVDYGEEHFRITYEGRRQP